MAAKILLVEDEESLLNALKTSLSDKGFEVHGVTEFEQAVELIESQSFDMIIADYLLGRETGIEILKVVREKLPKTHRVLMTGHIDDPEIAQGMRQGIIHKLLAKPMSEKQFSGEIAKLLGAA